jgi:hypothetical protein
VEASQPFEPEQPGKGVLAIVISGKVANLTLKFLGCQDVTVETDFDALRMEWVPDHDNLLRQQPHAVENFTSTVQTKATRR